MRGTRSQPRPRCRTGGQPSRLRPCRAAAGSRPEAAASIAAEAAEAALATAASAKVALEAATLAEASAARTAAAARALVEVTGADSADAASASAIADVAEGVAKERYGDAVARARDVASPRAEESAGAEGVAVPDNSADR